MSNLKAILYVLLFVAIVISILAIEVSFYGGDWRCAIAECRIIK